ncbi:hypothetical protein ACVIW2_004311 [Bradyrhizobium huanghuaihaiense]
MTVNVNISAWCALSEFAKPLARLILTPSGIFTPHMAELARAAASSVPQWAASAKSAYLAVGVHVCDCLFVV